MLGMLRSDYMLDKDVRLSQPWLVYLINVLFPVGKTSPRKMRHAIRHMNTCTRLLTQLHTYIKHTHAHAQSGELLQIEINTIASSLFGHSQRVFDMHRLVLCLDNNRMTLINITRPCCECDNSSNMYFALLSLLLFFIISSKRTYPTSWSQKNHLLHSQMTHKLFSICISTHTQTPPTHTHTCTHALPRGLSLQILRRARGRERQRGGALEPGCRQDVRRAGRRPSALSAQWRQKTQVGRMRVCVCVCVCVW